MNVIMNYLFHTILHNYHTGWESAGSSCMPHFWSTAFSDFSVPLENVKEEYV